MSHALGGPALLAAGQLFMDFSFSALPEAPRPGRERWTADFGWGIGGIANQAIAAARLGATVDLRAVIGQDPLSDLCVRTLGAEGVDTSQLRRIDGWHLPVTAALGFDDDRALVTGGVPAPVGTGSLVADAPAAEVATVHLDDSVRAWVFDSAARGTRVFADLGWDDDEAWDPAVLDALQGCHAFLPNEDEARAYTGAEDAVRAARALAERVPLVVVTRGSQGAVAIDAASSEEVSVDPVVVAAVDATGAGDVFGASLALAGTTPWSLRERLDFAVLIAAITVSRPGGASTAPRADELVPWLDAHPAAARPGRYGFLRDALGVGALPFASASV